MKKEISRKGAKARGGTRGRNAGDGVASGCAALRLCVRLPLLLRLAALTCLLVCLALAIMRPHRVVAKSEATRTQTAQTLIESALFTRVEFFGAQAFVPYPTAEARNRLAAVLAAHADEPEIYLKLAQLDEQLGRADEAARELERYAALKQDEPSALEQLASFYDRRADFAPEAATLERELAYAPANERAGLVQRLIELARVHQLPKYLTPAFYEQVIAQDPTAYAIIEQYIDKLAEQRSYAAALKVLRAHKAQFPERAPQLVAKEADLLDSLGRAREAEQVYEAAFDPFWPDELSDSFYEFLKDHDRYRAYGRELRTRFQHDPSDYDAAVRLEHFVKHDYDRDPSVFVQLERARAARGNKWKPEELATIARLLLADGYEDAASRFLYTLYLQGGLKPGGELRAKVLYQLFALLTDANDQRLALTNGDLKLYQDIATSDPHPGITGGILSLLLSDTSPRFELDREEGDAVKYFNRAAAYRIFNAYKQEYPTAPELAQMYLDIVRLYTATNEPEVAAATLAEFEARYADAPQFPEVALKLADCYITLEQYDKERALYPRLLDYLAAHRRAGGPLLPDARGAQADDDEANQTRPINAYDEPTGVKPTPISYPPDSNQGVEIPGASRTTNENYYDGGPQYQDHLNVPTARWRTRTDERTSTVTYAQVLERYVASLARAERNEEILALYSAEIKKHPEEAGLYEQMLQWLGQTKLVDEQLRVYQAALKQFPGTVWRDRMARWFLRQERKQEFEKFSRELLAQMNDAEIEVYLAEFIAKDASADAKSFEAQLYLGLYSLAHERFPHDMSFVQGLLHFYSAHERWAEWRALLAEYYFTSPEIRNQFLVYLAEHRELRARLDEARARCRTQAENDPGALAALPYKLFRADAAAWLSNYEEAIDAYRELNRLYPNTPEYAERLVAFTRSFGEHNRKFLEEAASVSHALADNVPSSAAYRTRAGELQAELGDYARARGEWEQLIALGRGEPETYLDTATIYWDYYQYADALRIINQLRAQEHDETLYAFQTAAILEAQHKQPAAISEYAKALDNNGDDYERAKRRLATLYKRAGVPAQLRAAVAQARASARAGATHDDSALVLGYVSLLQKVGQAQEAGALLRQEIAKSHDQDFLDSARMACADAEDRDGERAALRQLTQAARAPRMRISYRLQLATSYADTGETDNAASVVNELVAQYPTNYGVLNEAATLYWRLGRRDATLKVLRAGMTRGRGRFRYLFARKLATRELELNHDAEAERVLLALHNEDKSNTDVFHELMRLYVRDGRRAQLQQIFRETLAALKAKEIGNRDLQAQVAEFRTQLIDAFTRLKDYRAAVEQHIEIINRDPDDEEKLNAAITYVKRYGGADTLLDYYQKTAKAAYKNYRWNVVLARIYEAKGDYGAAAANYRAALENQPEMVELYSALAEVCRRGKDYDGALAALTKAAELSNDDPQYVRPIVTLLEQLGRRREAAARAKLPPEPQATPQTAADQFAAAARLRGSETAKAVATYRQAFDAFVAAPYQSELHSADITGYVQTVRAEEPLPQIAARLWQLRERLIADADSAHEKLAAKARERLQTLDGALPEALGGAAFERATGDELSALFNDWQARIDDALKRANDPHDTLALLQNLSRRANFGALEEKILLAQKETAFAAGNTEQYHGRLHALVDFYIAAGAYRRALDLLLAEQARDGARDKFDYLPLIADNARTVGDRERELSALSTHYERTSTLAPTQFSNAQLAPDDALVARYFDALLEAGAQGRAELQQLAGQTSAHQLQLVNFLLAHDEGALAHTAIAHAPLSVAWQLARNAEASLALKESSADNESYFVNALQLKPIGALVAAHADTSRQLVGDDWAQLAARYGEWLYETNKAEQRLQSRAFLPALIENRPHDASEQSKLGRWYLDAHDAAHALEHLQLARETQPDDEQLRADLGAAYFMRGDKERARAEWRKIIAGDTVAPASCVLYLRTLVAHGLAAEARAQLLPILSAQLKEMSEGWHGYDPSDEDKKKFADYKPLLRALADSFAPQTQAQSSLTPDARASLPAPVEAARAAFFRQLCAAAPESIALPELVVNEPLVARRELAPFYEMLIARSAGLSSSERDYDYNAQLGEHWDAREAEEALDHENGFKPSEPKSERLEWQRLYLVYLFDTRDETKARALVAAIETELKGRYARPLWLRLAAAQLELRAGRTAQAYDLLKHLVGIETSAQLKTVKPPDAVRLNEACTLLRAEGHAREAEALLASAYTRQLALAQYDATYFDALARLAFKAHDHAQGRALLQTMLDLAQEETRPSAEAALAAAAWLKPYAVEDTSVELPEAANRINYNQALALAAATAAEFAQFDLAISCRQRLRALTPDDEANRIELARLFAANGQRDEARENLAAIIADRTATRRARWQAVWLAPELCGDDANGLNSLRARVAAVSKDEEMLTALDALAAEAVGQSTEARALAAKFDAAAPNPYGRAFRALLDLHDGQTEAALASLNGALAVDQKGAAWPAFGLPADEALRELMHTYLALGQTRAALSLAERDDWLKLTSAPPPPQATDAATSDETNSAQDQDASTRVEAATADAASNPASAASDHLPAAFQLLSLRLNERAAAARVSLLSELSAAAEEIGEFKRTLEFEQVRLAALDTATERRACRAHIARLQAAQRQPASAKLIVDARTVAQH